MKSLNSRLRHVGGLLLAAALTGVVCPSTAVAEPSATDKVTARDLMREGKELRAKNDHEGARKKFQGAYAVFPTPITGLALARELIALGQLVEARELLGEILRMPEKATETDEGRKARAEASTLQGETTPRIPVIEITIKGVAAGRSVELTVDDKSVPASTAEAGLRVNPGAHTVVAKLDGREQSKSFDAKESERGKLELDFTVTVTPTTPTEPPKPIDTKPTESSTPPPAPKPDPKADEARAGSGTRWIGITAGLAGVVVAGVGGIVALKGSDQFHHPGDNGGICDATCQSNQSSGQSKTRIGLGLVGVGAAVAITGVVLWVTAPSDPKSGSTGPQVGVTPGGLIFRTTF